MSLLIYAADRAASSCITAVAGVEQAEPRVFQLWQALNKLSLSCRFVETLLLLYCCFTAATLLLLYSA
jgi:hypothetical protein